LVTGEYLDDSGDLVDQRITALVDLRTVVEAVVVRVRVDDRCTELVFGKIGRSIAVQIFPASPSSSGSRPLAISVPS
jgi:hypothetical protein